MHLSFCKQPAPLSFAPTNQRTSLCNTPLWLLLLGYNWKSGRELLETVRLGSWELGARFSIWRRFRLASSSTLLGLKVSGRTAQTNVIEEPA